MWDLVIFPCPDPRLPKIIKIAPITLTISQINVRREFPVRVYVCVWVYPSGLFPRACSHSGTNAPSFLFPTSLKTKWSPHWPLCEQVKKGIKKQYFEGWERPTRRRNERGPMTQLHKYEMCAAGCWHIRTKNRSPIHKCWKLLSTDSG